MKADLDNHSQERLADIKRAAKDAGLPEKIKLPSAVQVAQIAAGLGFQTPPATAVQRAVSLYIRAIAFKAKYDNVPMLDVVENCDGELALQLSHAASEAPFRQTFLLEPDKRPDEARRALAKDGLKLRTARSVLDNLREWHRLKHIDAFLCKKKIPVTWEDGKPLWLWGTRIDSELGADHSKLNETHKANCRMVTRHEYEHKAEKIAKQHGWRDADAAAEWKQLLAGICESRADGRVVYRVPSIWLGELIAWKKSLKYTGGVKSRQTAKAKKTSVRA